MQTYTLPTQGANIRTGAPGQRWPEGVHRILTSDDVKEVRNEEKNNTNIEFFITSQEGQNLSRKISLPLPKSVTTGQPGEYDDFWSERLLGWACVLNNWDPQQVKAQGQIQINATLFARKSGAVFIRHKTSDDGRPNDDFFPVDQATYEQHKGALAGAPTVAPTMAAPIGAPMGQVPMQAPVQQAPVQQPPQFGAPPVGGPSSPPQVGPSQPAAVPTPQGGAPSLASYIPG